MHLISVPPTISVPHQLVGAPEGSTVTLDCYLESSPSALHFWNRDDGIVLHEANKYRMQSLAVGLSSSGSNPSSGPSYRTHLRLTVVNVTDKDYGPYRCVAKNPFGEADGLIKLYRKSLISIEKKKTVRNYYIIMQSTSIVSRQKYEFHLLTLTSNDLNPVLFPVQLNI